MGLIWVFAALWEARASSQHQQEWQVQGIWGRDSARSYYDLCWTHSCSIVFSRLVHRAPMTASCQSFTGLHPLKASENWEDHAWLWWQKTSGFVQQYPWAWLAQSNCWTPLCPTLREVWCFVSLPFEVWMAQSNLSHLTPDPCWTSWLRPSLITWVCISERLKFTQEPTCNASTVLHHQPL